MIELPGHPFFLGCQFHPEFKSRPWDCHPLFNGFIRAAVVRHSEAGARALGQGACAQSGIVSKRQVDRPAQWFSADRGSSLIAGPCVIESPESCLRHAERLAAISRTSGVPIVFKSSFDKANRTSTDSFRGPGLRRDCACSSGSSAKSGCRC